MPPQTLPTRFPYFPESCNALARTKGAAGETTEAKMVQISAKMGNDLINRIQLTSLVTQFYTDANIKNISTFHNLSIELQAQELLMSIVACLRDAQDRNDPVKALARVKGIKEKKRSILVFWKPVRKIL